MSDFSCPEVELVFDSDSPFVAMPDSIRAKSDIPTSRQRSTYISLNGAAAYLDLPSEPPAQVKRDDGMVLARADLKTPADKAKFIGLNGADAFLALPAVRPSE